MQREGCKQNFASRTADRVTRLQQGVRPRCVALLGPVARSVQFSGVPDNSINPPSEPLPLRYNLDDIWGSGPATGTTTTFANAPAAAPDDATRLANLLTSVPYYASLGQSAAFIG